MHGVQWVHSPKGANFDSRFVSREGAKNAKERACDGFFVPSLEEVSSATEFRSLRVLRVLRVRNAFAPFGECTLVFGGRERGVAETRFSGKLAMVQFSVCSPRRLLMCVMRRRIPRLLVSADSCGDRPPLSAKISRAASSLAREKASEIAGGEGTGAHKGTLP